MSGGICFGKHSGYWVVILEGESAIRTMKESPCSDENKVRIVEWLCTLQKELKEAE
jgi:hypothetical protein